MKEEELIKRLENVELPEIEMQSHRRRLRMALHLNAGYLKRQRGVTILELAKSKVKGVKDTMIRGLVSRQPVWKTAIVGMLAVALVLGLSLTIPSFSTESAYAQAAEIAQNSPELRAALGDGEVQVVKVIKVVDGKGTVIAKGETGVLTAEVDLKTKEVTVTIPELTPEQAVARKQEAIDIAKSDPRVKELLDMGATIGKVLPMYSFGSRMNAETGEVEDFSETLMRVEIEWVEKNYVAHVDLTGGMVVRLIETTLGTTESYSGPEGKVEYFQGEKGPVEEPAFHIGKDGIEERNTQ
jgi:hypothetical protein